MANYNYVCLIGNITRDVELKYTTNQVAVANTGLAVNKEWTDQAGNKKSKVMFVDITAFNKLAEIFLTYLKKGMLVMIAGTLEFDQWTAKDGSMRSKHYVKAETMQMLGGKREEDGQQNNQGGTPTSDDGEI